MREGVKSPPAQQGGMGERCIGVWGVAPEALQVVHLNRKEFH